MFFFKFEPTELAQWHALVLEAEELAGYQFEDSLQHYLVITLDQFMREKNFASSVLAIDFLESMEIEGQQGTDNLRKVGDQCLLLSGLFPEQATSRNVNLNYFIGIGQHAYNSVADMHDNFRYDPELFSQLSLNFIGLMDVLHAMRA